MWRWVLAWLLVGALARPVLAQHEAAIRGCADTREAERERCFDILAAGNPRRAWHFETSDAPDDPDRIDAFLTSREAGRSGSRILALMFRCRERRTEMGLLLSGPVDLEGAEATVTRQLNDDPPEADLPMTVATRGRAVVTSSLAVEILRGLPNTGSLFLRVGGRAASLYDGTFPLDDIGEVRTRVGKACGW